MAFLKFSLDYDQIYYYCTKYYELEVINNMKKIIKYVNLNISLILFASENNITCFKRNIFFKRRLRQALTRLF